MRHATLALVENSIGPRMILTSRLTALGYAVSAFSVLDEFRKRARAETFDWLILAGAAAAGDSAGLLDRLTRRRGSSRIVWLGRPPHGVRAPIDAVFAKPLDYEEIVRFFSTRAPAEPAKPRPPRAPQGCCSARPRRLGGAPPSGRQASRDSR